MLLGWTQILILLILLAVSIWIAVRAENIQNLIIRLSTALLIFGLISLIHPMLIMGQSFNGQLVYHIIGAALLVLIIAVPTYCAKLLIKKIRGANSEVV